MPTLALKMTGVRVTVSARTFLDRERAFEAIAPVELSRIFTGLGPLPAVVGVREQTGHWDHVGATRVVELADGSEAREQITAHDRPTYFAYRVGPFTGSLRRLVTEARGQWWFSSVMGSTDIRWTYTFAPRPGMAAVLRLLLAPLWRRYARRALARALQIAEGEAGSNG